MSIADDAVLLIYIDNSNIWINTMEHSARKLKFINDIQQDQRIRVSINNLITVASDGRPIIRCVLYGSEPPPVKEFWNNVKECKLCKVEVQVTKRSTYSNREREVDQSINLDIGVDIGLHREQTNYGGTLILFTGDGGMISAVRRALQYNWNVEVWSYQRSLAKVYAEEAEVNDKLKIRLLDDYFNELVYYALEWRNPYVPPERSFVVTLQQVPVKARKDILTIFVESATALLRLPISGRFVHGRGDDNLKTSHLALVCNVTAHILKEDSRSEKHALDHGNGSPRYQFRDEHWIKVMELLSPWLDDDVSLYVKKELEFVLEDAMRTYSGEFKCITKYDFNKDVYQKAETSLINKKNLNEEDGMLKAIQKHSPFIRSVPQFLQDMRLHDIRDMAVEAPAIDDDGDGDFFIASQHRQPRRKTQMYSSPCKYGFRCSKGFKCTHAHSDKEAEFFKMHSDATYRPSYKFKECDHYKEGKCRFKGRLSYLCPFAHGVYCLMCKCDDDGGHDHKVCPSILQ